MLARANRLRSAEDFKLALRRGRRRSGRQMVVSVYLPDEDGQQARPRFGFILTRKVGNAVQRNRLRRQLRAAAAEVLEQLPATAMIVIRVLPGAVGTSWQSLRAELRSLLPLGGEA